MKGYRVVAMIAEKRKGRHEIPPYEGPIWASGVEASPRISGVYRDTSLPNS
jgi:hypothetical protein